MTPRKLSLIAATALLMAAAQAGAWGNSCKHSAQREASIERGDAARVEVIAFGGDLLIEPASGPTIQAQGRACASSKDYLEQTNIRAIRDNDVISPDPDEQPSEGDRSRPGRSGLREASRMLMA